MKDSIHPEYKPVVFYDVSADYKVLTRSTVEAKDTIEWEDGNTYPVVRFDLSSASHSFYTGKEQQLSDKGGRIEQFRRRYEQQQATKAAEEAATVESPVSEESAPAAAAEAETPAAEVPAEVAATGEMSAEADS